MMTIAVFYIARGTPDGLQSVDSFLRSYRTYRAGHPHTLYFLAKGWEREPGYDQLCIRAAEIGGRVLDLPDDGFDWGAYMRSATLVEEDWLFFLNTHSRILGDDWLAAFAKAARVANFGCAGCTGSWGTIAPSFALWRKTMVDVFNSYGFAVAIWQGLKLSLSMMSGIAGVLKFPGFPNPHLRSNAFIISRSDMLDFCDCRSIPRCKTDAWILESGYESLTRYLTDKRRNCFVVGKDMVFYAEDRWIDSNTFRQPGQRNLIISDNQTRAYEASGIQQRRLLELTTWGRSLSEGQKIASRRE